MRVPQQSSSTVIAAMAEDQGIFDLVTSREARTLLDEISLLHRGTRVLVLGDSCAASGVGNSPDQFLEGTLRDAVTVVNTAGGEVTCSQRRTLAVKATTNKGPMMLTIEDAILNTACPYILIPVGKLSRTKGIELCMPPWGKDGYFQYPNGVRVRMVNRNVWVIADHVEQAHPHKHADVAQTSATTHLQTRAVEMRSALMPCRLESSRANTWQTIRSADSSYMLHGGTRAVSV